MDEGFVYALLSHKEKYIEPLNRTVIYIASLIWALSVRNNAIILKN